MPALKSILGWVVMAGVWSSSSIARAQEGPELPTPGKEHALLSRDVGTWEATIKAWSSPDGEPEISKGTEVNTLLPGGLWVLSTFEGKMGGIEFHGRSQNGYDTHRKKYVSTWIDSLSTSPMLMEGTYDEAKKSLTMAGESIDPAGNKAQMRIVSTTRPDGRRVATFFMKPAPGADEFKMMEIEYVKKN